MDKTQYIALILVLFFLIGSPYPLSANIHDIPIRNSQFNFDQSYGYAIPLPDTKSIDENPDRFYDTLNLVNDLLRINIPLYWSNSSMKVWGKENTLESIVQQYSIEQGYFIVPFTECNKTNNQIIAIMSDYSIRHELHENLTIIPNFIILEPISIQIYQLREPNIAYFFGGNVFSSSMDWYVSSLTKAGFLNYEYLDDYEILCKLNNKDYNLLIWPGGQLFEKNKIRESSFFTTVLRQKEIKSFVRNGGGYVGSCYGAYEASSGFGLFPLSVSKYYIPMIPSLGIFMGLQDCIVTPAISCIFNVTIDDTDHPVTFGSNKEINGSELIGGCVYTRLGRNTHALGSVKEVDEIRWYHLYRTLFSSNTTLAKKIIDYWISFTTNKPIWTTSTYGDGKVVTFGDHPEEGDIHLQRIVHNAILYVTSSEHHKISLEYTKTINDINAIRQKTLNLSIMPESSLMFSKYYAQIKQLRTDLLDIQNHTESVMNITMKLLNQGIIDINMVMNFYIPEMWEFTGTIQRMLQNIDGFDDEDDMISNLEKIDRIYTMAKQINYSLDDQMQQYKNQLHQTIIDTNSYVSNIKTNILSLKQELSHYTRAKKQNQSIITTCNSLYHESKDVEKKCPDLYFDSLKMLRETWYSYETEISSS